jgi:hypothetical protein
VADKKPIGTPPSINGIVLGYMMYRSGLVPRGLAMLGLIGGPLLLASFVAVLFGVFEQVSLPAAIATIPEFLRERSLGIYLIVRGFQPSPITEGYARDAGLDGF